MNDSILLNCPITKTTSKVIRQYVDTPEALHFYNLSEFHSGIDIVAETIHSICQGVAVYLNEYEKDKFIIIIQYDKDLCFTYSNLTSCNVHIGDKVDKSQVIGECDDHVHFEVLKSTKYRNGWYTNVNNVIYYKHNPIDYASGLINLPNSNLANLVVVTSDIEFPEFEFSSTMSDEFSNNRVDKEPNSV